jgi:hypothetical protein
MPLNDDILDSSYALCEEFGPTRRIPREVRLKDKFPELSGNELQEVLGHVDQVSKTVWSIAERGGGRKLKRQQIIEELQRQHPFLRHEGLTTATILVDYYAWHEGYDG